MTVKFNYTDRGLTLFSVFLHVCFIFIHKQLNFTFSSVPVVSVFDFHLNIQNNCVIPDDALNRVLGVQLESLK